LDNRVEKYLDELNHHLQTGTGLKEKQWIREIRRKLIASLIFVGK